MRISKAKQVIPPLLPLKKNILLSGPPGVGKTDTVKQIASEHGYHLLITHPILDDRVDYKGLPGIVNGEAEFLPFGNLKRLLEVEEKTLVFMDDLGQAPQDVQAAIMQLILARELNGKKLSDNVSFIAATNRKKDKAGVGNMISPLLDRFIAILEIDFHIEDYAAWLMAQNYEPALTGYCRWRNQLLTDHEQTGEMEKHSTPRSVAGLGELLKLGIDDAETVVGAVGKKFGSEFLSFRRIIKDLPDLEEIWKRPTKAPVPEDKPDVMYALMSNLSHNATEENIDSLMKYITRCPKHYTVVCLKDLMSKYKALGKGQLLRENAKFIEWCNENKSVFVGG